MRATNAILERLIEEGMEEVIDLERMFWKPGERTIFLPEPKTEPLDLFFLPEVNLGIDRSSGLVWTRLLSFIADCSPGRGEYLGIARIPENLPRRRSIYDPTYADVQRSTTPAWRSRRWDVGRESR